MRNSLIKPALSACAAAISIASLAVMGQNGVDLERKMRELKIMDNIFRAALDEDSDRDSSVSRLGRPESMYLAGQGMVFTFHLQNFRAISFGGQGFGGDFSGYINDVLEMTRDSLEQVQRSFPNLELDFDLGDLGDTGEPGVSGEPADPLDPVAPVPPVTPRGPQVTRFILGTEFSPDMEAMHDMEDAMRDTQEKVRDQQREIRRLEREMRRQEDEAEIERLQAEMEKVEAVLEQELASLDTQNEAYEAFIEDVEEARRGKQLAEAEEASGRIIGTLCDYGATLRSLDNDEHVTIILEDVVEDSDQVYVFNVKDVTDCRSVDTLKSKAIAYQM